MIFSSPEFIETLVSFIANGGSPLDFCEEHKLRFDDLILWLSEDKEKRMSLYNDAMRARDEWLIQSVMRELKRISTVDIREAFDDSGNLRDIKQLSADLASVISNVEIIEEYSGTGSKNDPKEFTGYTKKIKFWDKIKSLELIGKQLLMFIDRHDHHVHGNVTVMPAITVDDKPLRFDIGTPSPGQKN